MFDVFHTFVFLALANTNDGETKGRELVAPFVEAPRSALVMNAPSRADWRALGLDHHSENSRFSTKTGPCYAKLYFGKCSLVLILLLFSLACCPIRGDIVPNSSLAQELFCDILRPRGGGPGREAPVEMAKALQVGAEGAWAGAEGAAGAGQASFSAVSYREERNLQGGKHLSGGWAPGGQGKGRGRLNQSGCGVGGQFRSGAGQQLPKFGRESERPSGTSASGQV